jgi:protease-4
MSMEEAPRQKHPEDSAELAVEVAAARPRRRGLIWTLVALYCAAVAAGALILARSGKESGSPQGLNKAAALLAAHKDAVGWVTVSGAIYQSESASPWGHGSQAVVRRLKSLAERKEVKAIVLDINSPGGSVGAVQEIYSQIQRIRREKNKPVVALFGDVAASGGYYIASACNAIVAHPGTLTGSIGVIFHVTNVEGLFSKLGIKAEAIKSGKMKDIGSMTRPMTKEERELLQGLIDDAYAQFLKAVSDGRKIPEENLKPLADGRIFTGQQALDRKLVDELGDSERALEVAAKLGGISGKPQVIRDADSLSSLMQLLDGSFSGRIVGESALLGEMKDEWAFSGLEYRWRQ